MPTPKPDGSASRPRRRDWVAVSLAALTGVVAAVLVTAVVVAYYS